MKFHSGFSIHRNMVSEPGLVLYTSISKGTLVLADYSSGDQDLEILALQCLEKTPHFHLTFSHTIRNRIYAFLIVDPFVYFGVFDEELGKPQVYQFLGRVKDAFVKVSKKTVAKGLVDNLKPRHFHDEFSSVFRRLLGSSELRSLKSPDTSSMLNQNGGVDSRILGKKAISVPLLGGKVHKNSKKKRKDTSDEINVETRDITIENKLDVSDEDGALTRDFSASLQKNGAYTGHTGHAHAMRMWWRHVKIVLIFDLVACCVLFVIWLSICKGFECMR